MWVTSGSLNNDHHSSLPARISHSSPNVWNIFAVWLCRYPAVLSCVLMPGQHDNLKRPPLVCSRSLRSRRSIFCSRISSPIWLEIVPVLLSSMCSKTGRNLSLSLSFFYLWDNSKLCLWPSSNSPCPGQQLSHTVVFLHKLASREAFRARLLCRDTSYDADITIWSCQWQKQALFFSWWTQRQFRCRILLSIAQIPIMRVDHGNTVVQIEFNHFFDSRTKWLKQRSSSLEYMHCILEKRTLFTEGSLSCKEYWQVGGWFHKVLHLPGVRPGRCILKTKAADM